MTIRQLTILSFDDLATEIAYVDLDDPEGIYSADLFYSPGGENGDWVLYALGMYTTGPETGPFLTDDSSVQITMSNTGFCQQGKLGDSDRRVSLRMTHTQENKLNLAALNVRSLWGGKPTWRKLLRDIEKGHVRIERI